ncbi:hypothetical protein [Lewinella sp. 4G2]|uniref:hypothetical protein n=1 Tax=Lewinella sp. 4G2 TaxID=1803372 RepID=UPI0007B48BD7|nr:hypothetical protein [Lewinella sp. 4G2]OAV44353.1 hypothetical protein A3850_007525 [Lewinella sp. 4G2]
MTQRIQRLFFGFLATIFSVTTLLAQADQESPFQASEPVTKSGEGLGSTIWIIVGIVFLVVVFFLLKKGGSGATRAGNPK